MKNTRHLAAAAALLISAPAAANHIDFIQDDSVAANGITDVSFNISSSGAVNSITQTGEPADILGGTRVVTVERDEGFVGSITASQSSGSSVIQVRNDTVAAGNLTLTYPDIGGADFTTQWDSIAVSIPYVDQDTGIGDGEFDLSVTVVSGACSDTVFADGNGISTGRIEEPGTFFFLFDSFTGVDFTDVQSVSVFFDTAIIGSDFDIASITRELVNAPPPQDVPAPAAFALLGLGAMGLGYARRRSAKTA